MVLYKLVVLGDGGVGKTALTIQLCLQHFVETVSFQLNSSYLNAVPPTPLARACPAGSLDRENPSTVSLANVLGIQVPRLTVTGPPFPSTTRLSKTHTASRLS